MLALDEDDRPAAGPGIARDRAVGDEQHLVRPASGIGDLEHELAVLLAGLEPPLRPRTSSSGRTESTSGRMRPWSKSRVTARNSESLAIVEPSTSSCFQKMRCSRAGGLPPVVAPVITSRPPRRSASIEVAQVSAPTCS